MSFWTLQYDGEEKSFKDWGFTDPRLQPRKLTVTTFTVKIPGATNLVSDPPIPFKGRVIIRRHREVMDGGGFSGGEIVFQGRQITDRRLATRNPADVLTFGDLWGDLENLTFQQTWRALGLDGETISDTPYSQLNLFQDFTTGVLVTNGAQIEEIIAWAVLCGVSVQAGTIDLGWYLQPYPASAVSCASAAQICLKPCPGAACWVDMTTEPPTFHCRERYYHQAISLPYRSGSHRSSELTPRYDMQVPQVVIQYRQAVSVNGARWTNFGVDAWPLDATLDAGVRAGKQVGAMVVPIQLADYNRKDLTLKVTAAALGNPPSLDWWKSKKPALAGYSDLTYVAGSLKVLNEAGEDITGTSVLSDFPNEYKDGLVSTWMRNGYGETVQVATVTLQAKFTYSAKDAQETTWLKVHADRPQQVSVNVRLTNSAVGTINYSTIETLDPGQTPVANLAQYTWTLLSQLFWEGSHSIVERNASGAPEVTTIVDCRYALNLTGGNPAWESMLAPLCSVDIDFTRGTTFLQFGLPKQVGPSDLEGLLQFYKWRNIFNNPNLRTTGNAPGSNDQVDGNTAKENTSDSEAAPTLLSLSFIQEP